MIFVVVLVWGKFTFAIAKLTHFFTAYGISDKWMDYVVLYFRLNVRESQTFYFRYLLLK